MPPDGGGFAVYPGAARLRCLPWAELATIYLLVSHYLRPHRTSSLALSGGALAAHTILASVDRECTLGPLNSHKTRGKFNSGVTSLAKFRLLMGYSIKTLGQAVRFGRALRKSPCRRLPPPDAPRL